MVKKQYSRIGFGDPTSFVEEVCGTQEAIISLKTCLCNSAIKTFIRASTNKYMKQPKGHYFDYLIVFDSKSIPKIKINQ